MNISTQDKRIGIARVINKSGKTSRSEAERLARAGRVTLNGITVYDPETPTRSGDYIQVDGAPLTPLIPQVYMLHKPRGFVTTANDEQGRETVFQFLQDPGIPHLGPIGRLDKASEGLLLFTNDTTLANALLDPQNGIPKVYHVQMKGHATPDMLHSLVMGVDCDGELLRAVRAEELRRGGQNTWLKIELREGRNREIRRLLAAFGHETLRLIRIAFGALQLGDLPRGKVRLLLPSEIIILRTTAGLVENPLA